MKPIAVLALATACGLAATAIAQSTVNEPTGQKSLAATINVYVFPAEGQNADQQSKDEAECYSWAVRNTESDPFDLAKRTEQQQQQADAAKQQVSQAGKGAGAKGALVGAAGGALIGEIASDDAGTGAAIGAGVGLIAARSARRRAQAEAAGQIDQQTAQAQEASAAQVENFKKAFSVCLEAKDYLVKF